jgi:hypothetical protein
MLAISTREDLILHGFIQISRCGVRIRLIRLFYLVVTFVPIIRDVPCSNINFVKYGSGARPCRSSALSEEDNLLPHKARTLILLA